MLCFRKRALRHNVLSSERHHYSFIHWLHRMEPVETRGFFPNFSKKFLLVRILGLSLWMRGRWALRDGKGNGKRDTLIRTWEFVLHFCSLRQVVGAFSGETLVDLFGNLILRCLSLRLYIIYFFKLKMKLLLGEWSFYGRGQSWKGQVQTPAGDWHTFTPVHHPVAKPITWPLIKGQKIFSY